MSDGLTPSPTQHPLPDLGVLSVHGPDAGTFLQGQLTQDVLSMRPEVARPGGYCSAKGRLMATFVILHPSPDTWWLVTRQSRAAALAKRLSMFVLRARCKVEARPDIRVWGRDRQPQEPGVLWQVRALADPSGQSFEMGWWGGRSLVLRPNVSEPSAAPEAGASAWAWQDVNAGWPWIEETTVEQFVPQMVNLELLDGVNFRKGCYPGQEVVARSQYRGILKRRMGLFEFEGAAPAAGTEIFHSGDPGQPAGLVVQAAPDPQGTGVGRLLAEVKIVALESGTLHLGHVQGPVLHARPLPYTVPLETA